MGNTTRQSESSIDRPRFDEGEIGAAGRVRHLLMAVDGSERATRGLVEIRALGEAIGVDVDTVEILEDDPVDGLVARFSYGEYVLGCIATQGRDRSGVWAGSVAHALLDRVDEPVLLVGPASVWNHDSAAPVVAAVDGSPGDASVVGTAAGWAKRMGKRLHLATVAELTPDFAVGAAHRRFHGPDRPVEHLEALAAYARRHGVETTLAVPDDPVVVAGPLMAKSERVGAALVLVGAVRHRGLRRIVLGSHAARIVQHSPALVLAVPLGMRS